MSYPPSPVHGSPRRRRRSHFDTIPTPAMAQSSTVRDGCPSDPRSGILPRGGAGWAERGDGFRQALRYLAFVTDPNTASEMSRRRSRMH
jgi:hypothetical protein